MSKNKGTLITSTIRPLSDSMKIPTAHANELLGGFQTVNSISDRNSISSERRIFGMLVYVVITDEFYQLKQIVSTNVNDNLNWSLKPFGVGTITEWISSVITRIGNPPVSPSIGDRYLITNGTGVWTGLDNFVVEWDGSIWSATLPTQGMTVNVDDETDGVYSYLQDNYPYGQWDKKLYVGDPFIIKNNISYGEIINVATGSQYFIQGDLNVDGTLNNWGKVSILNGTLSGTISNYGSGTVSNIYLLDDIISGTGISISNYSNTKRKVDLNIISGTGIHIGASGSSLIISAISITPSTTTKYYIQSSEQIYVPDYEEYFIYGDLQIDGRLDIGTYGKVVIVNGSISLGSGTVSNMGNVELHEVLTDDTNNIKIDVTELKYGKSGRILFESDLVYSPILGTFARVITESDNLVFASSSSHLTSTASYNIGSYLGLGTQDPLKKFHISGSGILINGSEPEQSYLLGDPNYYRFIIDTESNKTSDILNFKNDEGIVLSISSMVDGGNYYPSLSIGTNSGNYLFNISNYTTQFLTIDRLGVFNINTDINLNNFSINNSIIDGVYVATHSYRHLPDGDDALLTGTPSEIGTSNIIGTANSFSRQDHIHSHGNQLGGLLHATVSYTDSGFMSSHDKISIDSLIITTQSSVIITATSISINNGLRDSYGNFGTNSNVLTSIGNGVYWRDLATASVLQISTVDPIPTGSTSSVMMGFGTSSSIAPNKTGTLFAIVSGNVKNEQINEGSKIQLRYGIGTAPNNGDTYSGTVVGGLIQSNVNYQIPFSINGIIPNLIIGQPYWFDISLSTTLGTSSVNNVSISIVEV